MATYRCKRCLALVFQLEPTIERYEHRYSVESRTAAVSVDYFMGPPTITLHPDAMSMEVAVCIYLLRDDEVYESNA